MNEKNNIKIWYDAINGIFSNRGLPQNYSWRPQIDVVRVLNVIGKPQVSVAYEPNGKSANFLGANANGGIELLLEKDAQKITERIQPIEKKGKNYVLPVVLGLGHFDDNGAFTYFRLETNKGPYAFFVKDSPLLNHEIIPESKGIDKFREYINNLRQKY